MPNPLPHLVAVLLVLLYPTGYEPLAWAEPGSPWTPVGAAAGLVAAYGLLHALIVRRVRRSADPPRTARVLFRAGAAAGLVLFAGMIFGLHLPLAIDRWEALRAVPGGPLALALLPHFVLTAIRGAAFGAVESAPAAGLAVRARFFAGFALVPVLLVVALQGVLERLEPVARAIFLVPALSAGVAVAGVFLVLLGAPFLLRLCLGAATLRDEPLRRRFDDLAGRARFRARDYLVVPTGSWPMANAFISGLAAPVRYVFFTAPLLRQLSPDEAAAVFGHEMAHTKRGHLVALVLFFLAGMLVLSAGADAWERHGLNPGVAPFAAGYFLAILFLLFGFVSRRFESEADLVGASTAGSSVAYARALERVALVNGIPPWDGSWRHYSIARRSDLLFQADLSPEIRDGYLRRCRMIRWAVAVAFVAGLAANAAVAERQFSGRAEREAQWNAGGRADRAVERADAGDVDGAIAEMEEVLRVPGADSGAYRVLLARWCLDRGRRAEAEAHLRASMDLAVVDPRLRLDQLRLEEELGAVRP